MNIIGWVLQFSLTKTVIFNLHYFGFAGMFHFYAVVARGTRLSSLKGKIDIVKKPCQLIIGFGRSGICDPRYPRAVFENRGTIVVKGRVHLGPGTCLVCSGGGTIVFDGSFNCTANSKIICRERIIFGNGVLLSWDSLIMDTDFHKIIQDEAQVNKDRMISIGNHVWIGTRATVLKGSSIPDGSVVAAGSVITKTLTIQNAIYLNDRVLKEKIEWKN